MVDKLNYPLVINVLHSSWSHGPFSWFIYKIVISIANSKRLPEGTESRRMVP